MPTIKTTELLDVLERAEICLAEAARFLPVSRATLHNWKTGATKGDALRLKIVESYVVLLNKAVKAKRLPLSTEVKHAERVALIKKILTEVRSAV